MKIGDTVVLLDRSRLVVVFVEGHPSDSDVYYLTVSSGGRFVSVLGVFISSRPGVWVQNS